MCKKANKACFSIRNGLYSDRINVSPHLNLFDSCVKPIILYCSEIWSLDHIIRPNSDPESRYISFPPTKVQLKYAKYLLGVNKRAVNMAVLSELGMMPVAIDAMKLSFGYWLHLLDCPGSRLVSDVYRFLRESNTGFTLKIKDLLHKFGFRHLWDNQSTFSKRRSIFSLSEKIKESYIRYWNNVISSESVGNCGRKLRTYRKLKNDYTIENFLYYTDIQKLDISNYIKVRISNSRLLIEQGRHQNIELNKRICPLCKDDVEDEFHFVMMCPKLSHIRDNFFAEIQAAVPSFGNLSQQDKFKFIMSSNDYDISKMCILAVSKMYNERLKHVN